MERELAQRIFYRDHYQTKREMQQEVRKYIEKQKEAYPFASVTKQFYKGDNILVRVTQIDTVYQKKEKEEKEQELEKEIPRVREKGINGLGENAEREKSGHGGNERERGAR